MVAPEDEDESSKTEEPSERKLSKAKEEGDVAISQDVKSFIMLVGMVFMVWLVAPLMMKWFYAMGHGFVENPQNIQTDPFHLQLVFARTALKVLKILAIPFLMFMILGVFASVSQTGFIYSPKRLLPNWNKLNIFAALKNFINMQKIVESIKGIVKITLVSVISIWIIKPYLTDVNLMPSMDKMGILDFIHKVIVLLVFTITIAVLVLGIVDYLYQRYAYLKKLRMTKQELKEEYKEMEGDPIVKSRIKQIRNERARRRMMENVPKADVVIVNPTHYAVALEYKMETMDVPIVVAKGVDNIALKIKEVANENNIPIVENPPLARALYASVDIDEPILYEHFLAVAEVIKYVLSLKEQQ